MEVRLGFARSEHRNADLEMSAAGYCYLFNFSRQSSNSFHNWFNVMSSRRAIFHDLLILNGMVVCGELMSALSG